MEISPRKRRLSAQAGFGPRQLLIRVFVLAFLLAIANAWVVRHLGIKITGIGLVNTFLAVLGFLFARLGDSEKRRAETTSRRIFSAVLDTPVLLALAIVMVVCGSFVSSVTIMASGADGERRAYVTPEGRPVSPSDLKLLDGESSLQRYVRWTTPFGRPFYITVDGYQRTPVDLYPWKGAVIRVTRDMSPSPAVFLRIPVEKPPLLSEGKLVIQFAESPPRDIETIPGRACLLIGRKALVPRAFVEEWRSELKAANMPASMAETAIRAWKNVDFAKGLPPMAPGTQVRVEFISRAGKPVADAQFLVTSESFQDVRLSLITTSRGEEM